MNKTVPSGTYSTYYLEIEPMIAWFTTTEIGIMICTKTDLQVSPSFESTAEDLQNVIKKTMPLINIKAGVPTVVKFGSLVGDFENFVEGPPQTMTKIILTNWSGLYDNIFELYYKIPKYWAGPVEPNVPDFTFYINSCTKVLGDYETEKDKYPYSLLSLWSDLTNTSDLNILLGDNVYLSEYQFDTESGLVQRYKKLHNLPELSGSWSNAPFSAIPDDHDLGVNDVSLGGPGLYLCRDVFTKMWPNNNQNIISPMMWSMFRYDLSFIGLDCRSYSTEPGNLNSTILGDAQLSWLRQTLFSIKKLYSNSFVFICTGIPFIRPRKSYFSNYAKDQSAIINMIKEFDLKNVIFLTGSAHFSDISQWDIGNNIVITEFINSAMGTIPRDEEGYKNGFPPNPYLVDGTLLLNENNFGQLSVSGTYGKRVLQYNVIIKDGIVPVSFTMKQKV